MTFESWMGREAGTPLASIRVGPYALLIDASAFDALIRVRIYGGSSTNVDGGTHYLAGVVDRDA